MPESSVERTERIIRSQAVKFLHRDIKYRYQIENIRKIAGNEIQNLLEGFSQEDIDPLENLFFTTIYPEVEARQERDKSFESMIAILKSPAQLTFIIPALPAIILRYATIWPTALNCGLNAMLAYLQSVQLENKLVAELVAMAGERKAEVEEGFKLDENDYRQAYLSVPYSDGRRMIGHAIRVIRSGRNPRIIKASYNIMCDVQASFVHQDDQRAAAGQPRIYADAIQAINFGKDTLQKIEHTFGLFPPAKMNRLTLITRTVELAYLDKMHGKKA